MPQATWARSSAALPARRMPLARGKTRPSAALNVGQRSPSWNAKPVARKAPSRPACCDTRMGWPFQVAPIPRTARKQSSRRGSSTQPTTGPSASHSATETHQWGKPWTKFNVPSNGSTIQRRSVSPEAPPSSPTKPYWGKRKSSSARMAASAARSASLTKSFLVFSVMAAGSSFRKYLRSTFPPAWAAARQASRCASYMSGSRPRFCHGGFGPSLERADHAREHKEVEGEHRIPVDEPENAVGLEEGQLFQPRARPFGPHRELEPGMAVQLHLGPEPEEAVLLQGLHPPEVHGVAHAQLPRVAAAPPHAHAPEGPVQEAPDLPQPVAGGPAVLPAQ